MISCILNSPPNKNHYSYDMIFKMIILDGMLVYFTVITLSIILLKELEIDYYRFFF